MRVRGATLSYSSTTNGTYTAVAGLIDCDPPNEKVTAYDDTTLDTAGDIRDMQPGEIDLGNISFRYKHLAATFTAVEALKGVTYWWKYTLPKNTGQSNTGDVWKFSGFLDQHTPPKAGTAQNERAEAAGNIVLQSRPAFTAGT